MSGELGSALAYAMRRKREQEEFNANAMQRLLDRRQERQEQGEDRELARQDRARQIEREALQRQALELQLLEGQHRINRTGPYAPEPTRRPWEAAGFASAEEEARYRGQMASATRAPERAPEVNWQTMTGADGQVYQVHPRTGQVRPLQAGGQPLRTGTGDAGRALPASDAIRLGTLENLATMAGQAAQALESAVREGLNPVGPLVGSGPGSWVRRATGQLKPGEVSAQAALANIASEMMKARSGGAVTPQEFVRLEPFLPSKTDTEDVALQKLRELGNYLRQSRETEMRSLEAANFDLSRFRSPPRTSRYEEESPYNKGGGHIYPEDPWLPRGGVPYPENPYR